MWEDRGRIEPFQLFRAALYGETRPIRIVMIVFSQKRECVFGHADGTNRTDELTSMDLAFIIGHMGFSDGHLLLAVCDHFTLLRRHGTKDVTAAAPVNSGLRHITARLPQSAP